MGKIIGILVTTIISTFVLFGCTILPASQETGIGPNEYAEIKNTEKIKNENESLIKERDTLKAEIKKMENDYLELAKNNETANSKLEEAESKLDILENDGIPKFNSEKTDKNSIITYLNNNKNILNKSLRGIATIESPNENTVLFYTTGYGDSFNQIFMWSIGESEPVLIDGASFTKEGSFEWLNDKLLLIDVGFQEEYKVLDTDSKAIISTFYSKQDVYLIPGTATFIVKATNSDIFVFYDFINSKEQEINLDYKNKYTSYDIDETKNEIVFAGIYIDEYETEYTIEAIMNMDSIIQKYSIVTLEEAINTKENNTNNTNETIITETAETVESAE